MKQAVNLTKKNIAKGVERRMYICKGVVPRVVDAAFFACVVLFVLAIISRTCISLSEINTHTYVRAE
ncbi:membrane-associated protein, putative [Bodo saltans]|uniref:Membrane-associated protein, putative n=1 Tax=Bodo saltans TaxID=75058 RepID=A0A0S4IUN6_BODSA|nr:membrane-associated protein, putative [Bodo saltans]|eukprot:CUF99055.1 membrane-associated protein, putative [Bodo saltans]